MNKICIFLILICFSITTNAQVSLQDISEDLSVFPKEKIQLTTNSKVLLAGENLLYKSYIRTASEKESPLSKRVYVALLNSKDSIIFHHKLIAENGMSQGSYFTPATLKTGVYKLISYTNFSINNQKNQFAEKELYIVNPFVKTNAEVQKAMDTLGIITLKMSIDDISKEESKTEGLRLTTNKSNYSKRDKVTLKIDNSLNTNINGDFSLSVRKIDPLLYSGSSDGAGYDLNENKEMFYVPELRGELITGKLVNKLNGQPAENKLVTLTIPGNTYIFKTSKTNKKGLFFFSVSESYQTTKAVIQVDEEDRDSYKIELNKKDLFSNNSQKEIKLKLDTNLKDWIEERSIQLQIENAYYDLQRNLLEDKEENELFFKNLGKTYVLDNFTRFRTVKETFIEIIDWAAIRNENGKNKFIVYEEGDIFFKSKFNSLPALVLMDGMLVQDAEEILNYDSRDIESIQVVPEAYRYGPKVYSGLITINTKNKNYKPATDKSYVAEFQLISPLVVTPFYVPDYETDSKNRIPDYRVQLFWDATVALNEDDESRSFYTSDVAGIFEATLEGYTVSGSYITISKQFTVE